MSEWKPIESRPFQQKVLVYFPNGGIKTALFVNEGWISVEDRWNTSFEDSYKPTHWMQLPKPPEK